MVSNQWDGAVQCSSMIATISPRAVSTPIRRIWGTVGL